MDPRGRTPLELAVSLGHLESARVLLRHNANVGRENANGWTGRWARGAAGAGREAQGHRRWRRPADGTPCPSAAGGGEHGGPRDGAAGAPVPRLPASDAAARRHPRAAQQAASGTALPGWALGTAGAGVPPGWGLGVTEAAGELLGPPAGRPSPPGPPNWLFPRPPTRNSASAEDPHWGSVPPGTLLLQPPAVSPLCPVTPSSLPGLRLLRGDEVGVHELG